MATNLKGVKRGYADLKDGLQIYYETMGEGKSVYYKDRTPVIFLHQGWWNSFEFEKVIPIVAAKCKVFALDTLGFGYSPPAPFDWEFDDFCDSVIWFMDAMGIEKANFAGMHTGSLMGVNLAVRYPNRVDKLVLGGLAIYDEKLRKEKYARRRMIGWNNGPYIKALKPGDVIGSEVGILQKTYDGAHLLEMWKEQVRENPDSKLENIHKATMANILHYDKPGADALSVLLGWDLEGALPHCKAPALLIAGSRDCVKPPVFKPITYAGSLMSGLVRYKVIYGSGIMGWLDCPEAHAEALLGFLDDPEKYEGTVGHELELAMNEYLFVVEKDLKF